MTLSTIEKNATNRNLTDNYRQLVDNYRQLPGADQMLWSVSQRCSLVELILYQTQNRNDASVCEDHMQIMYQSEIY